MTYKRTNEIVARIINDLIDNGGATISPFVGEISPGEGYMIGGVASERVFTHGFTTDEIKQWVGEILPTLYVGHYLGAWIDHETDNVYLDVSQLEMSRDRAIWIARQRGELAIYDLAAGETIYVDDMQD